MYHIPLNLQGIYRRSEERGKNGDGEEWSEISGGGKSVENALPLVCR